MKFADLRVRFLEPSSTPRGWLVVHALKARAAAILLRLRLLLEAPLIAALGRAEVELIFLGI